MKKESFLLVFILAFLFAGCAAAVPADENAPGNEIAANVISGFELLAKSGNVSNTESPSFNVPEGNYTLFYYWKMKASGTTYRVYAADLIVNESGIYENGSLFESPAGMSALGIRCRDGDQRLDGIFEKLNGADTHPPAGPDAQTLLLSTPVTNNNTWFLLKQPAVFEAGVSVSENESQPQTNDVRVEIMVLGDTKTDLVLTDVAHTYVKTLLPGDKKPLSDTYNTSSTGTQYDPQPLFYDVTFENVPYGTYTLTITAENENEQTEDGQKSRAVIEKTIRLKEPSAEAITEDRHVVIITGCTYQVAAAEDLIRDGFSQDPENHIKFSHYQTTSTDISADPVYSALKEDMGKADIIYINMINTSVRGPTINEIYNMSKENNASYNPVIIVSNVTDTVFINYLEQTIPEDVNPSSYKVDLYTYFSNTGFDRANLEQMIYKMLNDFKDCRFDVAPAHSLPDNAIYHPDSPDLVYKTLDEYMAWYKNRTDGHAYDENNGTVGLMFYSSYYPAKIDPVDASVREMEKRGLNVIPIYLYSSTAATVGPTFFAPGGEPIVDVVVSCNRYLSNPPFNTEAFDIPVINGIVANMTAEEWKTSANPYDRNLNRYYRPENAGMVDPITIGYTQTIDSVEGYYAIASQITYLTDRVSGYIRLKEAENKNKNVAVIYYNHEGGKSGIGASYLDVAASIIALVNRMSGEGYHIDPSAGFTEETLVEAFLTNGYNVGVWAPGQLQAMVDTGKVVLIPAATYERWFDDFFSDDPDKEMRKQSVIDEWGEAPGSLMTWKNETDTYIVLPLVDITNTDAAGDAHGRVILAPQPARGQFSSYETLYHDGSLVPTHQYIAFYSWLQHSEAEGGFGADAIVYMGRHGTQEWLPGKETGLSRYEWPCLMHGSIPVVYYYIVDGLSEGIQAKRRGNAVIVDHLTPAIVEADLYGDYSDLSVLITQYQGAMTEDLKAAYKKSILEQVSALNLKSTLNMSQADGSDEEFDEFLEELDAVIYSVRTSSMPYGLHILGTSPEGNALVSTLNAMLGGAYPDAVKNAAGAAFAPDLPSSLIAAVVSDGKTPEEAQTSAGFTPDGPVTAYLNNAKSYASGFKKSEQETDQLIRALNAGYIAPGASGDPVRKPGILPTGYNFQTLDASSVPTKEAQAIGQKMAKEILEGYRKNGSFPGAIAYILWSSETVRHEGVMESCVMYLIGVEYDFSSSSSPTLIRPVESFDYPTMDVVMQISGLYRDMFPDLIKRLDAAVVAAYHADNPNGNFLREHIDAEKARILEADPSISEKDAFTIASLRVFGPESGNYGTGMSSLASASNMWTDREEMAEYYLERMGFAYAGRTVGGSESDGGTLIWGLDSQTLLKLASDDENASGSGPNIFRDVLSEVTVTVHSRSTNMYGVLDNDDFFQYLGGLNLAVSTVNGGKSLESFVMDLKKPGSEGMSTLSDYLKKELTTRYLNQGWLDGMMRHGYAGAGEMSDFVENLWGWESMMPDLVTNAMWDSVFDVYVNGSTSDFLRSGSNAYSYQSLTGRLLEASRTGNWDPSDEVLSKLVSEYVNSAVESGIACCHHTCGNPLADAYISGLMSSLSAVDEDTAKKFARLMEEATDRKIDIPDPADPGGQTSSSGSSGTGSAVITDSRAKPADPADKAPSDSENIDPVQEGSQKTNETDGGGFGTDLSVPSGVTGYQLIQKTVSDTASSLRSYLENPTFSAASLISILLVIGLVGLVFYGSRRKGL